MNLTRIIRVIGSGKPYHSLTILTGADASAPDPVTNAEYRIDDEPVSVGTFRDAMAMLALRDPMEPAQPSRMPLKPGAATELP